MAEPGKGTHWSNLISILGVGGKKSAEPAPVPAPEPAPVAVASATPVIEASASESPAMSAGGELQIDWAKPVAKKRTLEAKSGPAAKAKGPTSAPPSGRGAAPPAKAPAASPKKKHWGGLAEQLGLPPSETSNEDEPNWIEESESNGNVLSGDDAADECVSHPAAGACAPDECEMRTESCKMRPAQEEVLDTRDTEFLDDVPATDEDLDALADLINEGAPAMESPRRAPRRDVFDDEDREAPRRDADMEDAPRPERSRSGSDEDSGPRRRRRRGRGRGGRREDGESREGSSRDAFARESTSREPGPREGRESREGSTRGSSSRGPSSRDAARVSSSSRAKDPYEHDEDHRDHEEDLDREPLSHAGEDDLDGEMDRESREGSVREDSARGEERRPRRRRRRRRGSEDSAEGDRGSRRSSEPADRVRGADPAYRRKESAADLDDEEDSDDEPVAVHRNLPTWEDALSAIVAGNIENRARTPQQHYGNRGRGGGGGGRDRNDRGGDRGSDRGGGDRGGRERGPDRGSDRGPPRGRRDDRGGDRR